jgi:hypothetical protein
MHVSHFDNEPELQLLIDKIVRAGSGWRSETLLLGLKREILQDEAKHFDGYASVAGHTADAEHNPLGAIEHLPKISEGDGTKKATEPRRSSTTALAPGFMPSVTARSWRSATTCRRRPPYSRPLRFTCLATMPAITSSFGSAKNVYAVYAHLQPGKRHRRGQQPGRGLRTGWQARQYGQLNRPPPAFRHRRPGPISSLAEAFPLSSIASPSQASWTPPCRTF